MIKEGEELLCNVCEGRMQWGVDTFGDEGEFPLEYVFQDHNNYEKYSLWIKKVIRYLNIYHKEEYLSNEFIQESKKALWRSTFGNMITILKAYEEEEGSDSSKDMLTSIGQPSQQYADNNNVFIVHGHDSGLTNEVARFLEALGFTAIILHEQPSQGNTIIEKIEQHTNVGFAIVLYTPCDVGAAKTETDKLRNRARQNVVFEHGYLIAKLGRKRVCALLKEEIETPGDISGVVYIPKDNGDSWKVQVAKEMKVVGYSVDFNKII